MHTEHSLLSNPLCAETQLLRSLARCPCLGSERANVIQPDNLQISAPWADHHAAIREPHENMQVLPADRLNPRRQSLAMQRLLRRPPWLLIGGLLAMFRGVWSTFVLTVHEGNVKQRNRTFNTSCIPQIRTLTLVS